MFEAGVELAKVEEFLRGKLEHANLQEKLTIIDRYFFSNGDFGGAQKFMPAILAPFLHTVEILEVVTSTSKGHYNKKSAMRLAAQLSSLSIRVFSEDKFHDRFWIVDEKLAFVVGTSINGFGKRHFFIQDDYLSPKDTETILEMYRSAKYCTL